MADIQNNGNNTVPADNTVGSLDIDDNQSVSFYSSQSQQYPVENLEVHDPNAVNHSKQILHPLGNSFKFSRRRAMVVSLIITMMVIVLTGISMLFFVKYSSKQQDSAKLPTQQDITLKDAQDSVIPSELQGAQQSLLVNGDIVTRGDFKVSNGTSVSILKLQEGTTGNQVITLPNGTGTICLDNNNCGYAGLADLTGLQGQVDTLQSLITTLNQSAGITDVNGQKGSVSVQGSLNQISVSTNNGLLTLSTPQDLDANANVQFGSLAVSTTGQIRANKLIQTGAGNSINIDAGNDFITFTAGGRVFQLPNSGGANQTICTTGATCATGSGTAVILSPTATQVDGTADASIFINDTGGGNLLQLQTGGVDKLVVANNGNTTVNGSLTVSGLGNGFVKSTAGALSVVGNINLASSDITGTLAVGNGGTGLNTIPSNGVLIGNGASPVGSAVAGGAGLCLVSTAGAPSFQACPGTGGVASVNGQNGALTVTGTANQVNVNTASGTITLSTPQNIHVAATPTFAGLTLSGLGTGPVRASAGLLGTGNINLGSEVTGLLGVTLGGTGVSTTASNGQLLIGNGTGYSLATLTAGSGVNITNGAGTITIAAPSAGNCATCANQALSNLSGVALNTSLLTGSTTIDLGSNAAPFRDLYLGGSATNNFKFTGVATGARTLTLPDASGTLAISASGNIALSALGNISLTGQVPTANGGTGSNTAAGARTNLGAAASGANTDITSLAPSGTLTVGSTGQILTLQGNASTTLSANSGANATTLSFAAPSGTNTITFPALTGTVCVSTGNCATAGAAGGDLTGTYPNPTIAKLQGTTLNISGPTAGQVLIYNGTNGRWENHGVTGDVTLSETGTASIANNAVNSAKIADGTVTGTDIANNTVTNGNLVNSSLTVTAGNGLSGGGAVALGASTNLAVVYGSTANTAVQGNTAITITAGTGLTGGGNITLGVGGSSTLNVAYGSTAGTAVEGNKTLTCASGAGNLSGGGNVVTLGSGGTCNNLTITNSPVFSGTLAVQGATTTIGTTGQQGSVVLYDGGAGVASNTGTVQVIGSLGQDTTFILPDPGASLATICLSTGNCAGSGGGVTSPGGTSGKIAKFTGANTVADSTLSESGSTVTASGNVVIQGSNSLTLGTSSSFDGSIKFYNAAGTHFVALQAPATDPAADLTFKLPSSYGSNGDCLQSNGAGGLSFTSCTGGAGGGVTSIDGQTGVVSVNNATGSSGSITIDDASTSQKGIAQFNSTNFSASLGVIDTIQSIAASAAPTFTGLRLSGLGAGLVQSDASGNLSSGAVDRNSSTYLSNNLSVANGGTGSGTAAGARSNLGAAASGANSDITSIVGLTTALGASQGGTGFSSYTVGDLLYADTASSLGKLAAVAAGQCLVSNGVGTAPSWSVCPGSGGVSSVNTFTGAVTVQGTTNQVIVTNNTGTITLSTPQDINTTSAPQFSALGLTGTLTFTGVATAITTGANQDLTLNANGTGKTILSDAVDVAGLLSANGGIQTNGAGIATSNGALTLGSGNLTTTGTITSGLINGQTISSSANFTGSVTIQGSTSLTLGTSSSLDGSIAFRNAAGTHTVSLQAPTTDPTADFALHLPSAGPTGAGQCLLTDASGNLYFAACPGGGGVASLNGENGAVVISNASGNGSGTVTIDDATTIAKGIASFNSANFSVTSGAVSIKAGGVGSTEIADGSITGTDIGSGTVANGNLVNSSVTVNSGTNLTGGGAISLGGNITLNVASSPTFGGNVTVQGGTTTLGASGQQGSAVLYDGGVGGAANTGTVQVISSLGQDTTYTLPDPGSANTTICLSTGNCAGAGGGVTGSGTNGQVAFFNGAGTITSSANLLFNGTDVTVAGALSGSTLVSTVATGTAPLTVASTTLVTNFNADLLDGQHGAYYQDAGNLNAGVIASARVSGSYTGITGLGTISTGTWQADAIADAYLQDNITISALGTVDWAALNNYPAACAAGSAVTQLGDSITCTAFAAGSGSGNYIQNNTGPVQAGASFWIDGSGRADTKLETPLLDTATATALNIGTTNATQINLNKNVVVAASQSLTITGGATGTRPASPTEGMIYYDTTTKQLLTYANGKWQGDRSTATKIVAASNSSQAVKDAADYVATGTGDQAQINAALTAAAGGKVYLAEGTYTISGSISVPNDTTLSGSGSGTVITLPAAQNGSYNVITNSDTTTGTNVTIRDLQIDGNKSNETSGTMYGIYLNGMGGGAGSSARDGAKLLNITARSVRGGDGIHLDASSNNIIAGNTIVANGWSGIYVDNSSNNNTISGNISQGNTFAGFDIRNSSSYNTITGNTAQGNTNSNFYLRVSTNNNTITGNTAQGAATGIYLFGASSNAVTGNSIQGNTSQGIHLEASSNNNTIASNKIDDSGNTTSNDGIYVSASDSNTISTNSMTDSTHTSDNYAINIVNNTSDTNYLSDNTLGGGSINDAGTGTIYGGQVNGAGNFVIQPAGTIELMKNTNITGNLTVTNAGNVAFQKGTDYSTTGTTNDVNFGTGALFRLTGASAQTITGISGGTDGRLLTLINAAAQAATLSNNSGSSLVANRIITGTGSDLSIAAGASVTLVYDASASVWRVVGTISGTTSGSSYVTLQGSTPGTADVGNFNITGTGIAATLTGSTSVLTPTLDAATAGALDIGTNNATSINLNQNSTVAAGKTLSVTSGLTSLTGATTGDALNVSNSTSTGNIAVFKDNSTAVLTIKDGGAVEIQNTTNSASGLSVKDSSGNYILQLDTANGYLGINQPSPQAPLDVGIGKAGNFTDGFESGLLTPMISTSPQPWTVDNVTASNGTYSARSGAIGNSATSTMSITKTLSTGGTVSFWHWTSSESCCDVLHFYIDGVQQGQWSGITGWALASFPAAAGTHTFSWSFTRDSNTGGGINAVRVDDIQITNVSANTVSATFAGSVGIGTASPGYSLDVQGGSINTAQGLYVAGTQVLTSGFAIQNVTSVSTTGSLTVATTTATQDRILVTAAALGAARFDGTITNADLTAARTWTLPDESGTFCMQGSTNCGFATSSGSGNYIQNQNAVQQAAANFWISGTGRADTSITAPLFDTPTAAALNIGTTNATQINLNKNVVLAANQTLTLTGGSFPGSPVEGMVYYNTTNKQLYIYANGKWQADRTSNTRIVGTSVNGGVSGATASQHWYGADYVNSSTTSAQTVINSALSSITSATGGTVYLMEGTYIIDGPISIPNNVKLVGSGPSTIIKAKNGINANFSAIVNTDTTTGTNVTIQDLVLDGNRANQSGAVGMAGIDFNNMGGGSGVSARTGAKIQNVQSNNWYNSAGSSCQAGYGFCLRNSNNNQIRNSQANNNVTNGIYMNTVSNNVVDSVTIQGSANQGLSIITGANNVISNTVIQSVTGYGIYASALTYSTINNNNINGAGQNGIYLIAGSNTNTVTGNNVKGSGLSGIQLEASSNNTVSGNFTEGNSANGLYLYNGSTGNTVTGNTSKSNTFYGMSVYLNSNNNTVSGNTLNNNTSQGVYLYASSGNTISGNTANSNGYGFFVQSATYNNITANTVQSNTNSGMYVLNSDSNNISQNRIHDNSGATNNNGIYLDGSDSNSITANSITDTSATTTNYAINIFNASSDTNYLADNSLGSGSINNAGTGTIFGGQANNSGNFVIQPAGTVELMKNTNVTGTFTVTGATTLSGNLTVTNGGNVAFQKGADYSATGTTNNVNFGTGVLFRLTGASAQTITGIAGGTDGRMITLINAGSTAATLKNNDTVDSSAANVIITGTGSDYTIAAGSSVSLVYDSGASVWRLVGAVAGGLGGGSYVSLQGSFPGTPDSGNFNISATGMADTFIGTTGVYTPLLDAVSGALNIGTTNATQINLNQDTFFNGYALFSQGIDASSAGALDIGFTSGGNATSINLNQKVVVAASQSLTITGGATGTRPASPTEGTMYYDTTTKRIITYSNGKWQADRADAIYVAASNSSQSDKDAADYVATGTGDQSTINTALTAASGKKVTLLAGTYSINAAISVPNNTTLAGVGAGTIITIANSTNPSFNMLTNTTTTGGTGITIESLTIDGNKANQTGGIMYGIWLEGMGTNLTRGATISNVTAKNIRGADGIALSNSYNNTVSSSTFINNGGYGVDIGSDFSSQNNIITGSVFSGNTYGINVYGVGNTIAGNNIHSNIEGILFMSAYNTTVSGNQISDNASQGLDTYSGAGTGNTITGNTFANNGMQGIYLTDSDDTITGNTITSNGGSSSQGIWLAGSRNTISGNRFTDNGGGAHNDAITVAGSASNTITGNTITDATHTTDNYAITINAGSTATYLADNNLGTGTINDAGTGTIYGGQLNSSNNFVIQPAGTIELMKNTNITGNLVASGDGAFNGGDLSVATVTATDDTLRISVSSYAGLSFQGTITNTNLTAARTWTLPDEGGTICIVGSVSCLSGAGFVQFAPASVQADTSTNTSIFINKTGASGNLIDLQKSGVDLFIVNSTGAIQLGSTGNGITLSGSGGVTNGSFTLNGTARNTKTITMNAEYAGAVLDAANDASCSSANNGTMTSGFTTSGTSSKPEAYYTWTSTQATAQCYDVVVQVPIPSDFDGFTGTQSINVWSNNTTNGTVTLDKNVNGTTDGSAYGTSLTPGSASTWTNQAFTFGGSYTSSNANQMLTLRIRMSSTSNAQVNLGRITLQYYSKF